MLRFFWIVWLEYQILSFLQDADHDLRLKPEQTGKTGHQPLSVYFY